MKLKNGQKMALFFVSSTLCAFLLAFSVNSGLPMSTPVWKQTQYSGLEYDLFNFSMNVSESDVIICTTPKYPIRVTDKYFADVPITAREIKGDDKKIETTTADYFSPTIKSIKDKIILNEKDGWFTGTCIVLSKAKYNYYKWGNSSAVFEIVNVSLFATNNTVAGAGGVSLGYNLSDTLYNNILGIWDFNTDELGTSTCNDVSPNNNMGVINSGSIGIVQESINRTYQDNGIDTNDEGCVGSNNNLLEIQNFTIYAEIVSYSSSIQQFIFHDGGTNNGIQLLMTGARFRARCFSCSDTSSDGTIVLQSNVTYRIFAFYNGTDLCVDLDGTIDCDSSTGNTSININEEFNIGIANGGITSPFNGVIRQVMLWNRSLSEQERTNKRNDKQHNEIGTASAPVLNASSNGTVQRVTAVNKSSIGENVSLRIYTIDNNTSPNDKLNSSNLENFTLCTGWLLLNTTFNNNTCQGTHFVVDFLLEGSTNETSILTGYNLATGDLVSLEPTITILDPDNITFNDPSGVFNMSLNVTADEDIDTWWYELNDGANTSFAPNSTFNAQSGGNTLKIHGNDSSGQWGFASISFTARSDFSLNITINSPLNMTYNLTFMDFNVSSDENLTVCNYTIDDFATINQPMTVSITTANFTNTTMESQTYTVRFNCSDYWGNYNDTETVSFTNQLFRSLEHGEFEVEETILSSTSYIPLFNGTFNLTVPRHITFKGVGGVSKGEPSVTQSTLSLTLLVNGVPLFDEAVRTVGKNQFGVFNIPINSTQGNIGENNFSLQGKVDTKSVNASSIEIFFDADYTNDYLEINHTTDAISTSYNSQVFVNIANFTIYKENPARTVIDIVHKASTGSPDVDMVCYAENGDGVITPPWGSTLTTAGGTMSSGMAWVGNISQGLETWGISCKSDVAEIVDNFITAYLFEDRNTQNRIISTAKNHSGTITQTGGDFVKIGSLDDYTVINNSEFEIIATIIMQSDSGTQEGSDAPFFLVNSTSGCGDSYSRSLSTTGNKGTAKIYLSCEDLVVGQMYDFNVWVNVAAGETVTMNTTIVGYEAEALDIATGRIPPAIDITVPVHGANVSGNISVNATISDFAEEGWSTNLTLLNEDGSLNFTVWLDTTYQNMTGVNLDSANITLGNYTLIWTVTNLAGSNTDIHNITINNLDSKAPFINYTSPTPSDNATVNGAFVYINVTAIDDVVLAEINISLYHLGIFNQSNVSATSPFFINFSVPNNNANYTYNASATDGNGNINTTETRTVTVATTTTTTTTLRRFIYDLTDQTGNLNISMRSEFCFFVGFDICFDTSNGSVRIA